MSTYLGKLEGKGSNPITAKIDLLGSRPYMKLQPALSVTTYHPFVSNKLLTYLPVKSYNPLPLPLP